MIPNNLDLALFRNELDLLHKRIKEKQGPEDLKHLIRIDLLLRLCFFVGIGLSWIIVNPISIVLISMSKTGRWAMLGHHCGHGGYNQIPNCPKKYQSKYFAKGWRRWIDWMDWLLPGAWEFEHNILHHYHTGELSDPDFPQKNVNSVRSKSWPKPIKYIYAFFLMATWKLIYYAPNTLWYLEQKKTSNTALQKSLKEEREKAVGFPGTKMYSIRNPLGRKYWAKCIFPYFVYNFVLIPSLFFPLGLKAVFIVLGNLILAEILTNLHSFTIIVTNHAGEDIPYFTSPVKSKGEFYFRQVIGSVNYLGGRPWLDFIQGYTNYQIEHHLWPKMTMKSYSKLQPEVQKICEKYEIPYVRENVMVRLGKLLDLMVGNAEMKPLEDHLNFSEYHTNPI